MLDTIINDTTYKTTFYNIYFPCLLKNLTYVNILKVNLLLIST